MAISEKEAEATFRVAVLVAKAHGIYARERAELTEAFNHLHVPSGTTFQQMLEEETNLDSLMKEITSPEAQEACYHSAYAMAHLHRDGGELELKLLDRIKSTFKLDESQTTLLGRLVEEAKDTVLPSHIKAISDRDEREKHINEATFRYAVLSAVLGAFPVPGLAIVTDIAVVGVQVKLVRDVGQYYGHQIDRAAAKSLLLGVGVGTGARIALSNMAKLVPVFGSAVGAATSFAATYAVGKMAVAYFENDCKVDVETLKKVFSAAHKEGKEKYASNKELIDAKQKEHRAQLEKLATDRKSGKISADEYEKAVHELA